MGTPEVRLEHATRAHAEQLSDVMRPGDVTEVLEDFKRPLDALTDALDRSAEAYTALFDGEVAAMWGVCPLSSPTLLGGGQALTWLLTGRMVSRHPKAFLRLSRAVVGELLSRYEAIGNMVDARYGGALRWAAWIGFELGEPRPFGPSGVPFVPISMRRPHGLCR